MMNQTIELKKTTYTVSEAAEILGTTAYKLRKARKSGEFKMMGNDVPVSSIMDWLGTRPVVPIHQQPVDYVKLARQMLRGDTSYQDRSTLQSM